MNGFGFENARYKFNEDGDLEVSKLCSITGKPYHITVPYRQWLDYKSGMLLQEALKGFNASDREFFKTGITPAEWDSIFAESEES